jgi:hypothetical protein
MVCNRNIFKSKTNSFILAAPITFLYHTLFVYEKKLREKPSFRQLLIIGTLGKIQKKS